MGVTKYSLSNGSVRYRADFYVQGPQGDLRRIVKKGVRTREMAQAFEAKVATEAFEGRWFDKKKEAPIKVAKVWENFEKVAKRENHTWLTEVGRSVHLLRHLGDRRAASLTLRDIDDYRKARAAEKSRYGNFPATSTVNREVALLRHMLNHAVEYKDLDRNPLFGIKMQPEADPRDGVVSEAEFAKLCAVADDPLRRIMITAYDTGLRKGAVLGLRWSEVDLPNKCLRLKKVGSKTKKRPPMIPMTPRLHDEIKDLPRSTSGFVFVNSKTNKPWNQIRKAFHRARTAAGLPDIRFHDLRRSFCTNARRRGLAESVVMKMSGHKTRAVFDRYNIVNDDDMRVAVQVIVAGQIAEIAAAAADGNDLVTQGEVTGDTKKPHGRKCS